ncbi:STAS domain-containing protein [Kitasatospora aburaviensis]
MPKNDDRTAEPGALTVSARPWVGGTVLALHGELDIDSVDLLRTALDSALVTAGTTVVIDCGDLEFCDSTGLNAMLRASPTPAAAGSNSRAPARSSCGCSNSPAPATPSGSATSRPPDRPAYRPAVPPRRSTAGAARARSDRCRTVRLRRLSPRTNRWHSGSWGGSRPRGPVASGRPARRTADPEDGTRERCTGDAPYGHGPVPEDAEQRARAADQGCGSCWPG